MSLIETRTSLYRWSVMSSILLFIVLLLHLSTTFVVGNEHANNNNTNGDNNDVDSIDGLMRDMLSSSSSVVYNRIRNMLLEKTHTVECRKKILHGFNEYFDAIGREENLPFDSESFRLQNECPVREESYYVHHDNLENLPKGVHFGIVQNKTYQPPPVDDNDDAASALYIQDPNDLVLCYGILTHENPNSTIRLIEALSDHNKDHGNNNNNNNLKNIFIVHVDGKESSEATHQALVQYYQTQQQQQQQHNNNTNYVHILQHPYRVRVNWGGYSMVNATLQILRHLFVEIPHVPFHKFIHLASTNYPIASNLAIRHRIASYPLDANLVHAILKPSRPSKNLWHYFLECDDSLHRIYQLPMLTYRTHGINLYTSSQWFIVSQQFAKYLAMPLLLEEQEKQQGVREIMSQEEIQQMDQAYNLTFIQEFSRYIQHVVVADETFFGSALINTQFCTKHHNWNFNHLQFDQWENEISIEERDRKKCIMPNPNHCGRSPTTITMDYVDILELSDDLFARKFLDHHNDSERIKDILDIKRQKQDEIIRKNILSPSSLNNTDNINKTNNNKKNNNNYNMLPASPSPLLSSSWLVEMPQTVDLSFEGHGVLIVAKQTVNDTVPLCLGIGQVKNRVRLLPCFEDWVRPTLAQGWETGAVIIEETQPNNRWEFGACTYDGSAKRDAATAEIKMIPGSYSSTGPRCMLQQMDGIRQGRCLDGQSDTIQPGGDVRVYPCMKRWHQFVAFGNGTLAPSASMHVNVPMHVVSRIRQSNKDPHQEQYLCLGVLGRGDHDEAYWLEKAEEEEQKEIAENEAVAAAAAAAAEAETENYNEPQQEDDNNDSIEDNNDINNNDSVELDEYGKPKLKHFVGKPIYTTRCSNVHGVVEWLFVPYIVEEEEADSGIDANTTTTAASAVADITNHEDNDGVVADNDKPAHDHQSPTCPSDENCSTTSEHS